MKTKVHKILQNENFTMKVLPIDIYPYRALLLSEISKTGKWPKLLGHIQAIDAHDILNMLVG